MVQLNYQRFKKRGNDKGFALRLRLYKDGEVRYVNVTKMLVGTIKQQHWNQKKQYFTSSCPFQKENNEVLVNLKQKYRMMALDWDGTLLEMMLRAKADVDNEQPSDTVQGFINGITEELKANRHPDGTMKCSYANYEKCGRRLSEFCKYRGVNYSKLKVTDLTATFINGVFDWVDSHNKGKGMRYVSSMLHAIIARADKAGLVDIDDYKSCRWHKKRGLSTQKYHTLTEEQCKGLANLEFDGDFKKCKDNELYRDFCIFLLYTGQSPCDAISLRYSDIQVIDGIPHFIYKRRKISEKQVVPCSVPINDEMKAIMDRWKCKSKDGYVFPVRCKRIAEESTNNSDIIHFISKLNVWLKIVGKRLGCLFDLHSYVFRHTAITRYISKGVPIIYVANMMGTSVENCQKIYYNNHGDVSSRNKLMNAMSLN